MVLLNYNTYLNEPLKLVEKTFAFYRKFVKTAKVLYRGGFVVYGIINTHMYMYTCYLACKC